VCGEQKCAVVVGVLRHAVRQTLQSCWSVMALCCADRCQWLKVAVQYGARARRAVCISVWRRNLQPWVTDGWAAKL
jgi:hypothetical protein